MLSPPAVRAETAVRAVVRAPGRLHLGFLDPSAALGRRFGSLGLVIDGFETEIELAFSPVDRARADTPDGTAELPRAQSHLDALRARTGLHAPLALRLLRVLPPHAGFGSGTQLALAVGRAFARLHGLDVPTPQLAAWLGRGRRSGVGIAGFDAGGLIVDGGPGRDGSPAPVLARLPLPSAWRVVVVRDPARRGLSGDEERRAIAALPPLPAATAAEICHQVLMRVLPGAAGDDFTAFAAGVNRVQDVIGEHFAPAQGGSAWTSPAVGTLMRWLREQAGDAAAVGQSSWGPTGFAIVASAAAAQRLLAAAAAAGVVAPGLAVATVAARNRGAAIG